MDPHISFGRFFFFTPDAFPDKTIAGICAFSNQGAFVCWALVSLLSLRDVKLKKHFFFKDIPFSSKTPWKKTLIYCKSTSDTFNCHNFFFFKFPECHHGDSEIKQDRASLQLAGTRGPPHPLHLSSTQKAHNILHLTMYPAGKTEMRHISSSDDACISTPSLLLQHNGNPLCLLDVLKGVESLML